MIEEFQFVSEFQKTYIGGPDPKFVFVDKHASVCFFLSLFLFLWWSPSMLKSVNC